MYDDDGDGDDDIYWLCMMMIRYDGDCVGWWLHSIGMVMTVMHWCDGV